MRSPVAMLALRPAACISSPGAPLASRLTAHGAALLQQPTCVTGTPTITRAGCIALTSSDVIRCQPAITVGGWTAGTATSCNGVCGLEPGQPSFP